jgi:hypothetical protein
LDRTFGLGPSDGLAAGANGRNRAGKITDKKLLWVAPTRVLDSALFDSMGVLDLSTGHEVARYLCDSTSSPGQFLAMSAGFLLFLAEGIWEEGDALFVAETQARSDLRNPDLYAGL